jgi:hypothetical protein
VTGPMDADPQVGFKVDMHCGRCAGLGVITDLAHLAGDLWLVTWTIGHQPGCPGLAVPERTYLVDDDALRVGDVSLPSPPDRQGRQPTRPKCTAMVPSAGRQCRNPAGPDGLCSAHRDRP